jgi:hypothetical protein
LEALVGAQVVVIAGEFDSRHGEIFPPNYSLNIVEGIGSLSPIIRQNKEKVKQEATDDEGS